MIIKEKMNYAVEQNDSEEEKQMEEPLSKTGFQHHDDLRISKLSSMFGEDIDPEFQGGVEDLSFTHNNIINEEEEEGLHQKIEEKVTSLFGEVPTEIEKQQQNQTKEEEEVIYSKINVGNPD